ncbi:MAG: ADP-ribosylglycohydrolase family protein [Lentisphaerae bacterium]|nr:ADP-ribosylglycohydrolase family protein [Lentisphaerota bacterium]
MSFKVDLASRLENEIELLKRYGFKIPPQLDREALRKIGADAPALMRFYEKLRQLPAPDSPLCSTSDYAAILATSPSDIALTAPPPEALENKILGGWLGRAAGCILGKPLECGVTLPEIKAALGKEYPISDYLPLAVTERITTSKQSSLHPLTTVPCSREHLAYVMEDDDLNYTVLNLLLLEQKGFEFSTEDVGAIWASYLPILYTHGAERWSFINYLRGMPIDQVPLYLNPARDAIGAQIRADMFGYVCPAQPRAAAELAWREASFSHVADGIYGAMFVAGMIAAAFGAASMPEIIQAGLAQIPSRSRMAELIAQTRQWHLELSDWEAVYARIKAATPQYSGGHAVNNAAYVVNALLSAAGNFEKGITIAVMQGHDTDCNGATVGSVLGVFLGAQQLPDKWVGPLNDRLQTSLRDMSAVAISELARRTYRLTMPDEQERRYHISKCIYCGSTAFGAGCPYGPDRKHVHLSDEKHCRFCNSTAYGAGCPYSPTRRHVHGPGQKCVHCGSSSLGAGCPYSPDHKHNRME